MGYPIHKDTCSSLKHHSTQHIVLLAGKKIEEKKPEDFVGIRTYTTQKVIVEALSCSFKLGISFLSRTETN